MTRSAFNPFYGLLLVAGVVFVITACAYGLMTLRAVRVGPAQQPGHPPANALILFMEQHGEVALGAELLLLGVATVGAIGTEGFWQRRADRHRTIASGALQPRPGGEETQ